MTFDFTSQNFVLPTNFAFAYHDNTLPTGPTGNPQAQNLSVFANLGGTPTGGTTVNGLISAYPNSPGAPFLFNTDIDPATDSINRNLVATVNATAVPEPATLGMGLTAAVFGLGFALRRRKAAQA